MARQGVQLIAYPQQYGNTVESQIIWGGGVPNGNFTDAVPVSEYDYDNNDGMNGLSGEYNSTLHAEDCIVEIDNS